MSKQVSPFAALTGAEKQIRWLEYQSIKLPYVDAPLDIAADDQHAKQEMPAKPLEKEPKMPERPQPPPEVPRTFPADMNKSQHRQYDAVIARLKQAELQSRINASQPFKQG